MDERRPLELPDATVSDDILDKMSTLRKVRDKLVSKGVPVDLKPEFDMPEVPRDLSSLSNAEIGDLYATLLAWDNYFAQETAFAEAYVKEMKNKLQLIIVKVSGGVVKKSHSMDLDPRVMDARAELQEAEQEATLLKSTHSIFANRIKAVSRTIELRKMEVDADNRQTSISRSVPHSRFRK